ncbi:hypothetical protein C475_13162 [Halosimplex carlsbadense 2-9-1]|uniref:DUF58 domain-containing protein n=1 Tax=Halosimplex carlsbadense 2-9-1 TaxID=797114 RepID=M0CLP8_9EURY|nr:DUF58 domain-containing protein [Halosimplex carlsbadense]ELZ24200.1 hypothetical protein C475_13162 [Halosimplex carlsbadense 2-9-1]
MDIETVLNRLLIAIGAILFAAAAAMIVVPDLSSALPSATQGVFLVGIIAVVTGLGVVRRRLRGEVEETITPNPERPAGNPMPGEDVDRMLYEMTHLRQGVNENREHLEERLENLAVAVVRNREDCSVEQARRILEAGEWTNNETAAEFFQSERTAAQEAGLSESLLSGTDDVAAFENRFRVTVEELIEVGDVDVNSSVDVEEETDRSFFDRLLGRSADDGDDDEAVESNWNESNSSVPTFDTSEPFEDVSLQHTNRWLGVTAFALVAVGAGVVTFTPGLMLAGTVGIAYTIYARVSAVPRTEGLVVEREYDVDDPEPGDLVDVTLTVRNESGSMLPDLRMVDVVPDAFVVTEGVPRLHTALQSGAQAQLEYTVRVERGEYDWPLLVVARDFSGGVERTSLVTPEARMRVVPPLRVTNDIPVRAQTTQYAGDVNTKQGGAGLEFHSVREYRPGDPMNRINWKQVASTGELATIDFRQEKAATVTILFDTRQSAYISAGVDEPHAVDHSVHAASDMFGALYDQGNLVGLAAFDTVPCWYAPGAGSEHLENARVLFAQHPALSPRPPERQDHESQYIDPMTHVRRRLPSTSQVFLFSPLADDYAAEVARRLDSEGHLVTVISPDVTVDETVGQRLTRIERTARVRYLRERGIRVMDWDPDEQLSLEVEKAQTRWA